MQPLVNGFELPIFNAVGILSLKVCFTFMYLRIQALLFDFEKKVKEEHTYICQKEQKNKRAQYAIYCL